METDVLSGHTFCPISPFLFGEYFHPGAYAPGCFLCLFNWGNILGIVPFCAALVQTMTIGANRFQEVLVGGFAATRKILPIAP